MGITMEMSKGAYEIAKIVYSGKLTRSEGKIEINKVTGMNEGSAQAFITIFLAMMDGEVYKRAFNNATNRFLLESIKEDYGDKAFNRALAAVQQHIDYWSTLGKGNLSGLQRIVDQMQ
ncbi:hypothetical protein [Paucisalibacillus sp. EB02]|uniref:hypothetical protein n=1 Tax=Paucisalibacillus sp. EB02 TaxID=1347087 RepID=UPI0004B15C7F|nr:hypothetical protein [Paucisalibacillus sp. EB02]